MSQRGERDRSGARPVVWHVPRSLEGRVALVTGGGSGIGRAAAAAMAREGAIVAISDIRPDGAEETLSAVRAAGGNGAVFPADVTCSEEVADLFERVVAEYGRLDCACNNAGVARLMMPHVHDYPDRDWDRVLSINARGVWLCLRHEIRQMLRQGGGAIVNMASLVGLVATRNASSYVVSKHAVVGLTRAAAREYAGDGIRVNALCPGPIDTPSVRRHFPLLSDEQAGGLLRRLAEKGVPMGRMGTPAEIAESVVWLCSDRAASLSGQILSVDAGLSVNAGSPIQ